MTKRKVSNFPFFIGRDIQLFTTLILKAYVKIYFLTPLNVSYKLF